MRHQSKKTAARARKAQPVRDALKKEVGHCKLCDHNPYAAKPGQIAWRLDVHEIARGSHRQKALDKRFALLVVCMKCHEFGLSSRKEWPEARQLEALRHSRPRDYDLKAYNELIGCGPNRITEEEVSSWGN